jgi:reverse transcriptase-like protein
VVKIVRGYVWEEDVIPVDRPPDGDGIGFVNCVTAENGICDENVGIHSLTVDLNDLMVWREQVKQVWSRQRWRAVVRRVEKELRKEIAGVQTKYKRVGQKIKPMNVPLEGGESPGGGALMFDEPGDVSKGEKDEGQHGGKRVPRGSRLTPKRLAAMNIGGDYLTPAERQLFVDILFEFEGAIAFDESEMGLLHSDVEPPVKIHTVPHQPWQQQNLRLPKVVVDEATRIVKEKLANGTLEYSQGPYRNRYFLVAKKTPGDYRLINDVQQLNKITIRDAGMPPGVDEFSEEFAGYPILTVVDFFSGYYQISLHPESRDMTAFLTNVGLVRVTRLPTGWTNSVAVFMRIILKVLWELIPKYARPFVDDVALRGPSKDRYGDEEVAPGVRRFVAEHAGLFRIMMRAIWMSGLTISGHKCWIGMQGVNVVGMVCDAEGRRPDVQKVQKILDWPMPTSTTEARGFIGLVCITEFLWRVFQSLRRRFSSYSGRMQDSHGLWTVKTQWILSKNSWRQLLYWSI